MWFMEIKYIWNIKEDIDEHNLCSDSEVLNIMVINMGHYQRNIYWALKIFKYTFKKKLVIIDKHEAIVGVVFRR